MTSDVAHNETVQSRVQAVLRGGPDDIPQALRAIHTEMDAPVIKIERLGGYEHFHRSDEVSVPVVYNWLMRTRIAE